MTRNTISSSIYSTISNMVPHIINTAINTVSTMIQTMHISHRMTTTTMRDKIRIEVFPFELKTKVT